MKRLPLAMAIMASLTATSAMAFSSIPQPVEHKKSVGSMGANGWASAEESVTGGAGATADRIYTVTNRKQLIEALYGSQDANINADPSNEKKVIYIKGKIDLSANQKGNKSMTAEDFMAQCEQYGYNDYDTFYQAYRNEFNPHTWNKQSLASNGRPPAVSGPLEDARDCYQKAQVAYTEFRYF
ncbi:hypothetical protein [Vibrio casei]|uniref:hypothetical protein n=1 Tax=Vibrio casei TaxID=673372 RepID=UPI003F9625F6